ncbi:TolC family protein [Candidatus Sumerlaeota bacterium]
MNLRLIAFASCLLTCLACSTHYGSYDHIEPLPANPDLLIPPVADGDKPTSWPELVLEIGEPRPVSLSELLTMVLDRNLDIRVQRYDQLIADDEIGKQQGIYDVTLSAGVSRSNAHIPSSQDPEKAGRAGFSYANSLATGQDSRQAEAALQQLLPSGAALAIGSTTTRDKTSPLLTSARYDPFYSQQYGISIIQPLLKNFGPTVTNSGIDIARRSREIAAEAFRQQVLDQTAAVMSLYWDLVFAINDAEVQQLSLEQAEGLLRVNTIKFDAEVLSLVDVLLAKAGVATRQSALISAKARIRRVQDSIKRTIRTEEQTGWHDNLLPRDTPGFVEYPFALEQCLEQAFLHRPDLRQLELASEIARIGERVARNQRLPSLDIAASYSILGYGDDFDPANHDAGARDYETWSYGIELTFPLQNRAARYAYKQAQTQVAQSELSQENLRDRAILGVRDAMRNLTALRQQIDTTKAATEYEQAKLDAEQKRYDVGESTSQDILDYQEDLATARSNHFLAIVEFNKAVIELERTKGTLLDTLGIPIETIAADLQ